jgi:exonuclease III
MAKANKNKLQLGMGIHTYNVRGIRDKTKRLRLFTHFKTKLKGIIFLQETYSAPGDLETWSKE